MTFGRVKTVADLMSLDGDEIMAGYMEAKRGDPEPGPNRGRAYWHGWRCAMIDFREIENDAIHRALVHEYVSGGYLAQVVRDATRKATATKGGGSQEI